MLKECVELAHSVRQEIDDHPVVITARAYLHPDNSNCEGRTVTVCDFYAGAFKPGGNCNIGARHVAAARAGGRPL